MEKQTELNIVNMLEKLGNQISNLERENTNQLAEREAHEKAIDHLTKSINANESVIENLNSQYNAIHELLVENASLERYNQTLQDRLDRKQ